MRAWEQAAVQEGAGIPVLMQRAGAGVADVILADARCRDPILILAGPGNNGGDAIVAGRRLQEAGREVRLALWRRDAGAEPRPPEALPPTVISADQSAAFQTLLDPCHTVVDGLLGTGRSRPAEGDLKMIFELLAQRRRQTDHPFVVAVDLPSGTDADTGAAEDTAVHADLTVALGCPKAGTYIFPAAPLAGEVRVVDIGLPARPAPVSGTIVDAEYVSWLLPARPLDSNKGSFGRVTVIGGSEQYTGAPTLVARAAGRAGAGLVAVAMPRCIHGILATKLDEAIFAPQPDEGGALAPEAVDGLAALARRSQAIALGPGLSQRAGAPAATRALLQQLRRDPGEARIVVDADALSALAAAPSWWNEMPEHCVLTPHPGEMGRLTGTDAKTVQRNRVEHVRRSATQWRQIVLLKGAHTLVAHPDGRWWLVPCANPALATAGTGDVLTGIIAGLLAQGAAPVDAAITGAWVHAEAGETARRAYGSAGVLAGDLLPRIPGALERARSGDKVGEGLQAVMGTK